MSYSLNSSTGGLYRRLYRVYDLGFRVEGLNSLKGRYIGDHIREYYRGYQGDTRSLDYSSCGAL